MELGNIYSIGLCVEEFRGELSDFALEYTQFRQTLKICLKNFQENGLVTRNPGNSRPKKRTPVTEVMIETRVLLSVIYDNSLVCL